MNGIIQHIPFSPWLLPVSVMVGRYIRVTAGVDSLSFFLMSCVPFYEYSTDMKENILFIPLG